MRFYELKMTQDERPCLTLEYCPASLAAQLGVLPSAGGATAFRTTTETRLDWEEAVEVASQVLKALGYLHGRGLIHRDIKPSNVMMALDGRWKLSDFGLVKAVSPSAATLKTRVVGTIEYMAPEARKGRAEPRSDLWAVGALLHRCLTGEDVGPGWREGVEEDCPQVPVALWDTVGKALERRPENRYQGSAEMLDALGVVTGKPSGTASGQRAGGAAERQSSMAEKSPQDHPGSVFDRIADTVERGRWAKAIVEGVLSEADWLIENEHSPSKQRRGRLSLLLNRSVLSAPPEVVERLLKLGADPNAAGADGSTALHRLADERVTRPGDRTKSAEFLVANGADASLRDFSGRTPLERAQYVGVREALGGVRSGPVRDATSVGIIDAESRAGTRWKAPVKAPANAASSAVKQLGGGSPKVKGTPGLGVPSHTPRAGSEGEGRRTRPSSPPTPGPTGFWGVAGGDLVARVRSAPFVWIGAMVGIAAFFLVTLVVDVEGYPAAQLLISAAGAPVGALSGWSVRWLLFVNRPDVVWTLSSDRRRSLTPEDAYPFSGPGAVLGLLAGPFLGLLDVKGTAVWSVLLAMYAGAFGAALFGALLFLVLGLLLIAAIRFWDFVRHGFRY